MLNDRERKWAYQQWCIGYTLVQIADALNCNEKTVRRAFKSHGLPRIRPILIAPPEVVKPSADTVSVVRCKVCKHYSKVFEAFGFDVNGLGDCLFCGQTMLEDDFCSRGETK
jgi:ribosomal protein S27E